MLLNGGDHGCRKTVKRGNCCGVLRVRVVEVQMMARTSKKSTPRATPRPKAIFDDYGSLDCSRP